MTPLAWWGLLTAAMTGTAVLALAWPMTDDRRAATIFFRVCLAVLLGVALHSMWHMLWLAASGGRTDRLVYYLIYDAALSAGLYLLVHRRARSRTSPPPAHLPPIRVPSGLWIMLGTGVAACILGTLVLLIALVPHQPHGSWDAWAMWNPKSRWFALGGEEWARVLTDSAFAVAHPDYPLLLPASVARLWLLAGGTPPEVPQSLAIAAPLMTMVVVAGGAWVARGAVAAVVAGSSVLLLPGEERRAAVWCQPR